MMNVRRIRDLLLEEYAECRDCGHEPEMIELIGTSFIADEPGILRPPNKEYIARELEWYLSQSRKVDDIPGGTPKIWRQVADMSGRVNSNYGHLIFSSENGSQYDHVRDELRRNRNSRRGAMIYTRPSMHVDATRNGMNDFVCTHAVNYFIREGHLDVVVQMRSNDAVFGYPNDYAWQRYVQEQLAGDLDVPPGYITWQAASLHVYPRHHYLLEEALRDA